MNRYGFITCVRPPVCAARTGDATRCADSREVSRPVVFVLVGLAGYVLQTMALWLLMDRAGFPVVLATVAATEAAVLHNFVWHLRWTWADRPARWQAMWRRLVRFNVANGGVSLVGGAMMMALLVDAIGLHYLAANLVTVLACSVANYVASDRWVFGKAASVSGWGQTPRHNILQGTGSENPNNVVSWGLTPVLQSSRFPATRPGPWFAHR